MTTTLAPNPVDPRSPPAHGPILPPAPPPPTGRSLSKPAGILALVVLTLVGLVGLVALGAVVARTHQAPLSEQDSALVAQQVSLSGC